MGSDGLRRDLWSRSFKRCGGAQTAWNAIDIPLKVIKTVSSDIGCYD